MTLLTVSHPSSARSGVPLIPSLSRVMFALLVSAVAGRAQTPAAKLVDSARIEIDGAVAANDSSRLARAVALLDRSLIAYPDDPYLLHYRGYAGYRQAVDLFTANRVAAAAPVVERARSDLDKSGAKLPWPETFALLAAVSGFAIGIDPNRGMDLGPQIGMLQSQAMQLGPRNPRVWLVGGIAAHHTPPEYGGGADRAREMLKKALDLFASDTPGPLAPAWGRDQAAAYLKSLDAGGAKPRQ
ncbi:MAG TPA: hypothetical protein VHE78_09335 [Gemmatimonadaceae bacterium]|nr:hypothetical protein [Gemmatimonadaceae bacterium]